MFYRMSGHKILRLMIPLNYVKNYTDDCVTVDGVQFKWEVENDDLASNLFT